jgi:hypothetical protein
MHGLFGTQMSKVLSEVLPKQKSNFIITDSTYPGAGAIGVAHMLPDVGDSWDQLKK